MLFKLSIKNMKKSFKDYAIYFITMMIRMLEFVSVFVAVILGLLIVYANNFLINRRKKEFGIYMTLGMGKRQISKIILFETILVGILSLIAGIVIGIFASQFMSVLVAKLFEANMTKFEFVFSKGACIKTCIYFAVMYLAVMFFNTITISRYKLINLLTAIKKNETIKLKNPIISILVFLMSAGILAYSYWKVTAGVQTLDTADKILPPILMGIIGTIGVFWSLSGFILRLVQSMKKTYLKGTNMFVLRQLNNKINTTVVSMSVICLMLFMTISVLSSSLSLRNTMQQDLKEMTPVDINLYKTANLPEKATIYGKDVVEIPIYADNNITWKTFFGDNLDEVKTLYPMLRYETAEQFVKVSDYNKIARLYGQEEYELKDNEYIVLCDFDSMKNIRNMALKNENKFVINGKEYVSKYNECKSGYIMMSTSHVNTGIILVPDSCDLKDEQKEMMFLAANYNANTDEEKEKIEAIFTSSNSGLIQNLADNGLEIDGLTKIAIIESSVGIATLVVFIAIYLGIIFLIASSAILALKQLTESSDNRQRYIILRKIGCDEKMINQALFRQIGIFFILPLILAIIHSIFGIQFALSMMSGLASTEQLLPSVVATVLIIGVIYGMYFLATYWGSKNIIKEEK